MTTAVGGDNASDTPGHQIYWFGPDRPVNGGTVFILPADEGSDGPTEAPTEDKRA